MQLMPSSPVVAAGLQALGEAKLCGCIVVHHKGVRAYFWTYGFACMELRTGEGLHHVVTHPVRWVCLLFDQCFYHGIQPVQAAC